MGLQNSLWTGMSGLLSFQTAINALANNTANINATGYKKLDTSFGDLLYSTITPGYAEGQGTGATNTAAIGNGVLVAAQTHNFTQGPLNNTQRTLDFAVDGDGFFVVNSGSSNQYLTRAGDFYLGLNGGGTNVDLLYGDGLKVMGYNAVNGELGAALENIVMPGLGTIHPGFATTEVALSGNISATHSVSNGNTITGADGWLNAQGEPIAAINVGGVQTSAALQDRATGAPATAETLLTNLSFAGTFGWENLFNPPANSTIVEQELTVDFSRGGVPYTKTLTVADTTTLSDFAIWLTGSLGDDSGAARADSGILGTTHTRAYTAAADGFDAPSENAGAFLSSGADGAVNLNLASNVGYLNYLCDFTLSVTSRVTNADGKAQNIVNDFSDFFRENAKYPVDETDNPVSLFDWVTPHPDVYKMRDGEQLISLVKIATDAESSTWRWYETDGSNFKDPDPNNNAVGQGTGIVRFDAVGNLISAAADNGGAVKFDFTEVTQFGAPDSLSAVGDGYTEAALKNYTTGVNGTIYGEYDNGYSFLLAKLGMAVVTNPQGLTGIGGTMFQTNQVSGTTIFNTASAPQSIFGQVYGGYLEASNFELGADAIIIERAYQFSSRIITTTNEMLQTAYNLKQ